MTDRELITAMNLPRINKDTPMISKWPFANKFPFENMQVGDSFAVPEDVKRVAVSVAAKRYGDKHKMRFTVRLAVEDGKLRCWRIA